MSETDDNIVCERCGVKFKDHGFDHGFTMKMEDDKPKRGAASQKEETNEDEVTSAK